jgi:transcriptional regulator with XRE-family HTH domain
MPRPLTLRETAPYAVKEGARQLGARLRIARRRRGLRLRDLAQRAGIAYDTARAVEQGNLLTGIGAYFALIWALGLEEEFGRLMDPKQDAEGERLALAALPQRVPGPRLGSADNDF